VWPVVVKPWLGSCFVSSIVLFCSPSLVKVDALIIFADSKKKNMNLKKWFTYPGLVDFFNKILYIFIPYINNLIS
jgi:hypothetical protein